VDHEHERRMVLTGRWKWRAVADGGDVRAHARWRVGFIVGAARRSGFSWPSSSTEATVWAKGGGVVAGSLADGGLGVRAQARANASRGTSLWPGGVSRPIGTQCPRSPASDRRSLECIGVRA
jgi:hypothetical protein